jgi:hypothetical protein
MTLLFSLVASAAVLITASPARACSCGVGTDASNYEQADAVFLAEVDRIHEARTGGSEGPMVAVLRVSDVFKGAVDRLQGIATPADGASCGFSFEAGVPYVVFASKSGMFDLEDEFYSADLCGGTRELADTTPAFAAPVPPSDGGPPSVAAIQAQLGDPRSSIVPEMLILAAVLAFVLGLAGWFSRENRPTI